MHRKSIMFLSTDWWHAKLFFSAINCGVSIMYVKPRKNYLLTLKCTLECNWNTLQIISKKSALTFEWWIDEFLNRFHFFTVLLCSQHYKFDFCMRDSYELCLITVNNMISLEPFIQSSTQFNSQWTYQITSEVFNCHL